MTDYEKLVRALRCEGMTKRCDSCEYGYRLSPDSECNDACDNERLDMDAADAIVALVLDNEDYEHENRRLHGEIEALQAEQKKTVTQIFGEEQIAWEGRCKDLMKHIGDLQAEADALKHDIERYVGINAELTTEIEALQAEVERLKEANEELREKQTIIDHYGIKWMMSANDVPNAAYEHGYADGKAEERAKMQKRNAELHAELEKWVSAAEGLQAEVEILKVSGREAYFEGLAAGAEPKHGKWVRVEDDDSYHYECSECGERPLYSRFGDVVLSSVCPMCWAKMEVQE